MDIAGQPIEHVGVSAALIVAGAVGTFVVTAYFRRQDKGNAVKQALEQQHKDMQTKIDELDTQLRVMREAVAPISMVFQQILIKELTHFHEKRTDELLAKIGPPYMLTEDEENELQAALQKRIEEAGPMMPEMEINAAIMLPMMIKRVKAELAMGIPPPGDTKTVTVSVVAPEDQVSIKATPSSDK